ncbi:MAG: rane protein [Actinoallomurus sp.]|jgi:hypothetical protein|nr:rane protein [Actinoallomurus sp.]
MSKLVSKPVTIVTSMLAGTVAGVIFKQVWKLAAREDDAPDATDFERRWAEVLAAAALEGAIFGAVKAAVRRATASRPDPAEDA